MRKIECFKGLFLLSALAFTHAASAVTIGFGCITNNNAGNCTIGETQLSVELTDIGSNQVLFTFMNSGSAASSIEGVYFDDGTLLGIASLIDADDGVGGDLGVDFSEGASPPNLPGGNSISPAFVTTAGFLADADAPMVPVKGVNPGESLGVIFDLIAGVNFNDTVAALGTDLRIGVHVIAFDNGGSESFVSTVVPVPAAVWLFGSGLLGLVGVARRRS